MAVVIVLVSVFFFLSIEAIGLAIRKRRGEAAETAPVRAFPEIHVPKGLFLGDGHSWARLTESGELRIGLDELIAEAIGGADSVELPRTGTRVRKGEPLATITRLGRTFVVPSPVDGTVVATNETVEHSPSALEADPYGSGWLATVWPVDHTEALRSLRVGEKAARWLERELERFTAFVAHHTSPELVGATLPDGARPVVGAALTLDDEGWQRFQEEFTGLQTK